MKIRQDQRKTRLVLPPLRLMLTAAAVFAARPVFSAGPTDKTRGREKEGSFRDFCG